VVVKGQSDNQLAATLVIAVDQHLQAPVGAHMKAVLGAYKGARRQPSTNAGRDVGASRLKSQDDARRDLGQPKDLSLVGR
jgi:hypothetical protein